MDISGKINVFVKKLQSGQNVFTTSVSKKEDGNYKNKYLDVKFSKEVATIDQLNAMDETKVYNIQVNKGFLSCEFYKDKEGNEQSKFVLVVQDCKSLGNKVINGKKEQAKSPF